MTKKKRVIRNIIVISIVFIIVGYFYYTFPRKFQKEYEGIQYRLDDNRYSEEVEVKFDGYLIKSFFKGDTFQGVVEVGDYKLGQNKFSLDEFGRGILDVSVDDDLHSYGGIYFDNNWEKLSINVLEKSDKGKGSQWRQSDGLVISAPATNRTEALEVSNELMKDVLLHELQ